MEDNIREVYVTANARGMTTAEILMAFRYFTIEIEYMPRGLKETATKGTDDERKTARDGVKKMGSTSWPASGRL